MDKSCPTLNKIRFAGGCPADYLPLLAMENILAKALGQDESQLVAVEKHGLLGRLLGRLAHEIRNPLSSLDIHVQLLEEDLATLTPEARKPLDSRLEIIHGELHRLESIVERFLRLAGPSALEMEPAEIPRIVTHVCELLRAEASTRQIEIITQIEYGLPPVTADPVRLTQALMNLVINAVQAVEKNGRVEVSAAKSAVGDALVLRVQDNGPGIPANKLEEIFDPYFTTKPEGIGLGLWIARQIAVAHGGTLRTENAPTGGAIFTLLLPLSRKENPGG
jgi:two-component system sensor histidine kinase HydH